MSYLITQIIPAFKTIEILGNVNAFESWLKNNHSQKNKLVLFEGYRFALNCCLNTFVDGLTFDSDLEIENDFLLLRAAGELQQIHLLPNTCEKIVFLKNIKPLVKDIIKSKDYKEMSRSIDKFNRHLSSQFEQILNKCISISEEVNIGNEKALNLLLLDFAHTYLMQIKNNGPVANTPNPLAVNWTDRDKKEEYLEGYKYTLQFLWNSLLGDLEFKKTHLIKLHEVDSWRTYNYIEYEKTGDPLIDSFNEYFNLEEQTNFDSYFYWVKNEVTDPFGEKYKIPIYTINNYFRFSNDNYNKVDFFGSLLDNTKLQNVSGLSWDQKINECLYWYSYELVDSDKNGSFLGVSSFNTMLAGSVALHVPKTSEFPKIIIAKFTHPRIDSQQQNDYSYGILVDTQSASNHYSSGWVIYQNVCGDYSGFSGSEFRITEKLIAKYIRQNKIELRELTIPLLEFIDFTNQQVLEPNQISILEQYKLIPDILQKSKATLFELFTYYLCNRYYNSDYKVLFSEGKKTSSGEKDIVILNDKNDEVILIECKLNPNSYNMSDLVTKMEAKSKDYPKTKKSFQFWFWEELSTINIETMNKLKIDNKSIEIITLSKRHSTEKILKGVSLKQLNFIMQDYTI